MSIVISEQELPVHLSTEEAVEAAYARQLADVAYDLQRGLPVLIECDKDLAPFVYMAIRSRLRVHELKCVYLDGRPRAPEPAPDAQAAGRPNGFIDTFLEQLRDVVRGAVERRVAVLPHLDLLTTTHGGLTTEVREVIPLLYENPELVWLGFKDPSFPLPEVIEGLFPHHYHLLGIDRDRLRYLVTQSESRKFGREFNPWMLYKHVSGMNAVRLRRLLTSLEGEDYPDNPQPAYRQIRKVTATGSLEIPHVDLQADIGGYAKVKKRLRTEILDVLALKDAQTDPRAIDQLEELIPKGMIFWGPPGTGKTLFAKAMASAMGAAITVVSGPELKSRWVGESEENLRRIFHRARQSAPAVIVFDELDSFASARGTYTGSGVEHSMVNQLLTEMDGFHKEELVFVVGTTNFVDALDPALLRPGRFEFLLHIPHPAAEDRREILKIYDQKMNLQMENEALEFAVRRTAEPVELEIHGESGTRFTGDHLNALCRSIARNRIRHQKSGPTQAPDIETALTEWIDRPVMTPHEQHVVATHEAGHAVCSMFCEHAAPIERISIQGDSAGRLGFVRYQDPTRRYVVTRSELLDDICVLMGGREAESLLLDDLSIGSAEDLGRATQIARGLVEQFGMGGPTVGVARYLEFQNADQRSLSAERLEKIDLRIAEILEEQRARAAELISTHRQLVQTLRDLLVEQQVLEAGTLHALGVPVTRREDTDA